MEGNALRITFGTVKLVQNYLTIAKKTILLKQAERHRNRTKTNVFSEKMPIPALRLGKR